LPMFLRDEMNAHEKALAQGDFVLGFIFGSSGECALCS
jgi:hypothetical protein